VIWKKHYWVPPEHGAWFMWLGPLLTGILAAGRIHMDVFVLAALILAGFLVRQPLTIAFKAVVGRRSRNDLWPAAFVAAVLGAIALLLMGLMLARGHKELVWLALASLPVLIWQFALVARREERQMGIELVGAGVLALAAPAAYWVLLGEAHPDGWWLWGLAWLYAAASIVFIYLRLEQRRWGQRPGVAECLRRGARVLLYTAANLIVALILSGLRWVPPLSWLGFALAVPHVAGGVLIPAVRARPARIGLEQASATLAFSVILGLSFSVGMGT
jgi:YwiC-like protein